MKTVVVQPKEGEVIQIAGDRLQSVSNILIVYLDGVMVGIFDHQTIRYAVILDTNQTTVRQQYDIFATMESLFTADRKIEAVKALRSFTGWSLKESKEFIDKYIDVYYTQR